MKVNGVAYRTIWSDEQDRLLVIDQRKLPHHFEVIELKTVEAVCEAIRNMTVRGAGLIGVAAGYGMWLATREVPGGDQEHAERLAFLERAGTRLRATRPTASNLAFAVERQLAVLRAIPQEAGCEEWIACAKRTADQLADEDADFCRRIGEHGKELIEEIAERKRKEGRGDEPVEIMTHCNAGWLAFTDYGSALSPVYAAHDAGICVHVWVDETRPRNQGASLTAWELGSHGVPHSLIADNVGGHLMQHGGVDLVLTGADRVTRCGDAANKIGTYLKALAAYDNHVPMYIALPSSTFDFAMRDGVREIPIEERDAEEVRMMTGYVLDGAGAGETASVRICPEGTPARNWAFDVTPARLITGFICERGICEASEHGIMELFPEEGQKERAVEGVIKYEAMHLLESIEKALGVYWSKGTAARRLRELDAMRTVLHDRGLIGVTADGTGYGNISISLDGEKFCISGSGTGKVRELRESGYCVVTRCDPDLNEVVSRGPVCASSESMTHWAVYRSNPRIGCVAHVHSAKLFGELLEQDWARTPKEIAYGTPEMAAAVKQLVSELPGDTGSFVTAGHPDGFFVYGATPGEVLSILKQLTDKVE